MISLFGTANGLELLYRGLGNINNNAAARPHSTGEQHSETRPNFGQTV